jgi:hypothetical protein
MENDKVYIIMRHLLRENQKEIYGVYLKKPLAKQEIDSLNRIYESDDNVDYTLVTELIQDTPIILL